MASGNVLHSECLSNDPRVEDLIQKLEETCERVRGDKPISVMKHDETSSAYIPLRIRDIIQETLSPNTWGRPLASSLTRENSNLLKELDKAQSLLSQSRKECYNLGVKYITISEKVEKASGLEKLVEELHLENKRLQQELAHLKETLKTKDEAHELHLRAYQDTCQKQEEQLTLLEERLADYQEKYLETDRMLKEKEAGVLATNGDIVADLEARNVRLEKKLHEATQKKQPANVSLTEKDNVVIQQRTIELAINNQKLREQLRDCQETNQRLMDNVHELTFRWRESQARLEEREKVWHEKMETQSNKSMQSHQTCLVAFFQDVADVKDQFSRVVSSIQKQLAMSQEEFKLVSEQLSTHVEAETKELKNVNEILMLELQQKEQEVAKLSKEIAETTVKQETLNTKHQLIITSYKGHFGTLGSSLKEAKDRSEEHAQVIENLEASKAEIEYGKSNLAEQLLVTQMNLSQVKEDVTVLRSCIDTIIEVFSPPTTQLPDPSHQHQQKFPLQPKLYDTAEDVKRIRDWAISVVKCGVSTRDEAIQSLESQVAALRANSDGHNKRLSEVNKEAKAHSASNKMLKDELNSFKDKLQALARAKNDLERQVDEANSMKVEAEYNLAQSEARLNAIMLEKGKMQNNNLILQDSISKMKYELEKVKDEKQFQAMDLVCKHNASKKLELHFQGVEDEAKSLRDRIAELEAIKQDLERQISRSNFQAASFQMEKEALQMELKAVRDSEAAAVTTLTEMKVLNKKLECDKRQLIKSLKEATARKTKLDQENVFLEKMRVENEDELQKLKGANVQLTEQVGHLDASLNESEHFRSEVQNERDCLSTELAALSEALGKTKHALAEVQIQRGKLNNIIAQMAQEKGELIQDKVSSNSEITKLQESLTMSGERLTSLQVAKERLEQRVNELASKVITAEENLSDLNECLFSLKQEKQDLLVEKDKLVRDKDEDISRQLNMKDAQLQDTLMHAKVLEADYQSIIQREKATSKRTIQDLNEAHENEMTLLGECQQDVVAQLKEEIESVTEVSKAETARLVRERKLFTAQFNEEKLLFEKRLEKLQSMFEEKCEEVRSQYEKSSHMAAEQKAQIDTSNLNYRRLESELSTAEHHIQNLKNKLDEVKRESSTQAESLRDKLKEATMSISQLESSYDNSMMTIKSLEGQRDTLQRQTSEVQTELENAMKEKGVLQSTNHEYRQDLTLMEREMARINVTVSNLETKLKKREEALHVSEKNAETAHNNLTKVENLHAKLISDHAALQASLTNSERDKGTFQLDLRSAQEKVARLERHREGLISNLAVVENKLRVANKTIQCKESEVAGLKQRAANLERERKELTLNLFRVQESLRMQGQADAVTRSELQSQVSELRSIRDALKEEIGSLKISLKATQNEISENEMKLSISCDQASSLSAELKESDSVRKDLLSRYTELLAVLSGTLGLEAIRKTDSWGPEIASTLNKDTKFSISQAESGMGDSLPTSFQSSFFGANCETQMSKFTSVRIDTNAVRDAILDLQMKQSVLESLKVEAFSSVSNFEKKIARLEDEKASLEARLSGLHTSMASLQDNFDSVSRQRDAAEVMTNSQKRTIDVLEQDKKRLEVEVDTLCQQVEAHVADKREIEAKLKLLTSAQVGSEVSSKQYEMHALNLEIQNNQKDETIFKQKALISKLQSTHEIRSAEIVHLQQKLASSHQSFKTAENHLKTIKDSVKDVDSSLRVSQGRETKLLEKIKQLGEDLLDARSQKVLLNQKLQVLNKELTEMKREQGKIEKRLSILTQSQANSDMEKTQLQERIQQLESSVTNEAKDRAELRSKLQSMEMKVQQTKDSEMKIVTLTQDQEQLTFHIRQIEDDMETAVKGKEIANELCSSLESEKEILCRELQAIREENSQLKSELREASFQSQRLDLLMASQQKEKSELDHSLFTSSKENIELMKTLREFRVSASEREKESSEKVENLSDEVNQLQSSLMIKEARSSGREQSYRKTVSELETKVRLLESKLGEYKQRKLEFLEKAQQHEKSIQGARRSPFYQPLTADGLEPDLSSPSPISSGSAGCRVFSLSPTLPTSGCSPSKEERGVSPRFTLKYPITSTPNAASRF